jgi:predicted dehydrogenase
LLTDFENGFAMSATTSPSRSPAGRKIRYAVIGLGHIAQSAVLPAFGNASSNSELTALVSGDPQKLDKLSKQYNVTHTYSYAQYVDCLASGAIDAVYIALPNSMHREYTVRAAEAGIHVLCEKPMAVSEDECNAMIEAARQHDVKLMIAYRLHFEEANLKAIEIVESGKLGEPRLFNSVFGMTVAPGNIRLKKALGGGPIFDIGIYCINAARCLFQDEPIEVTALSGGHKDRFLEVEEAASAILRFPGDRLAAFSCSFGSTKISMCEMVGTEGRLRLEPAYDHTTALKHYLTVGQQDTEEQTFSARDQFAPELLYFSDCILDDRLPEPSGEEGLADVRIINALYRSIATGGRPVRLLPLSREMRPSMQQQIWRPPVGKQPLVHVQSPSGGT